VAFVVKLLPQTAAYLISCDVHQQADDYHTLAMHLQTRAYIYPEMIKIASVHTIRYDELCNTQVDSIL